MTITEALKDRYNKDYLSYSSIKFALKDMAQFDRYMNTEKDGRGRGERASELLASSAVGTK